MRPVKPRRPFTLYKKMTNSGPIWYARFWNEAAGKYTVTRSTGIGVTGKRERRAEAMEAAWAMLPAIRFTPPAPEKPFTQYLADFWTDGSPYIRECPLVKKRPLSAYYVKMNHDDVRRYMEPFPGFKGVTVGSLTKATLKKWLIWLAGRKTIRRKRDGTIIEGNTLSGRRANAIVQSLRVAIRWAVDNEEIVRDPFRRPGEITEFIREKGVLTLEERNRLIAAPL